MPTTKRRRYGPVSLADTKTLREILTEVVADFERVEAEMEKEGIAGLQIDGVQTFGKAAHTLHQIVGQLQMGVARHKAEAAQAKLDGVKVDK